MAGTAVTEAFIPHSGKIVSIDECWENVESGRKGSLFRCLSCGELLHPRSSDLSDLGSRFFVHEGYKGAQCPSFFKNDPKYYFLKPHLFDARMQDEIKKSLQRVEALTTKATIAFHKRFTWGHEPQRALWKKTQDIHLDKLVVLKDHPWLLSAFLMMSLGRVSLSAGNYTGDYVLKGSGKQELSFKGYDYHPCSVRIPKRLDMILMRGRRAIREARDEEGNPISFPLNKDAFYELAGMKEQPSVRQNPYARAVQMSLLFGSFPA
ncbi:MAG: hypothetical protein AB7S81_08400 [Bdellovibrionales bacterium]